VNGEIWTLARMTAEPSAGSRAARAESPDAFDRLFLAEYARVVAIAYRVLADRYEAEDVAQEVFVAFLRRHSPEAGYARPWLHSAAAHTALNTLRGRRRRERREAGERTRDQALALNPEQIVVALEQRRAVRAVLRRLPARSAAVLALRYSGLSYAEMAAALGVGLGQVGTLLRRAEAKFRKEVARGTHP